MLQILLFFHNQEHGVLSWTNIPGYSNGFKHALPRKRLRKGLKKGFDTMNPDTVRSDDLRGVEEQEEQGDSTDQDLIAVTAPTLPALAQEAEIDATGQQPTAHALAHRLALAIRCVAADIRLTVPKQYSYEEWVEFTRLIRFSSKNTGETDENVNVDEEDEVGLVEWDWIGASSPLVAEICESEWLLQRLCESLVRIERRKEAACRREDLEKQRQSLKDAETFVTKADSSGRGNVRIQEG